MLTCAFYGTARINDPSDTQVGVDFTLKAREFIDTMSGKKASDLRSYVNKFARHIQKSIVDGRRNGIIGPLPSTTVYPERPGTHLVFCALFDGYYKEQARQQDVIFIHRSQTVCLPILPHGKSVHKGYLIYGPPKLARELQRSDCDPRLLTYRSPAWDKRQETLTLSEGVGLAKDYIRACKSDAGREIDPACGGIGGDIQIATITPSGGFSFNWVPNDEPVSCSSQ